MRHLVIFACFLKLFSATKQQPFQAKTAPRYQESFTVKQTHVFHVDSDEESLMALYQMDTGNDNHLLAGEDVSEPLTFSTLPDRRAKPVPIQNEDRWYERIEERDFFFKEKYWESDIKLSQDERIENDAFKHDPVYPFPNDRDPKTVLAMAILTNNAYTTPPKRDWITIDPFGVRVNISFGWDKPGLRGHVFATSDNKTLIIAYKGTSPGIGALPSLDKFNDNLMFSCCCGRVDSTWKPLCPCYRGQDKISKYPQCSSSCLEQSLNLTESYYNAARVIYNHVRKLYPSATIWFTGHSLGGAIASLMSLTTGWPAWTLQAPGEKMYATRLGFEFPQPSSKEASSLGLYTLADSYPIFHFGNTADPIFTGQCTGRWSPCYYVGFAMESKCHIGKRCTYMVEKGLDIRFHQTIVVIDKLLKTALRVPECVPVWYPADKGGEVEDGDGSKMQVCKECSSWRFLE